MTYPMEHGANSHDLGASGESLFQASAQLWGWKIWYPLVDYGIDRFVVPIGPDSTINNAVFGAQIKTGPTWFREPSNDSASGTPEGWWFRLNDDHANLWIDSRIPMIIVLVDPKSAIWYWQEISGSTLQSTGKGFKVFVPREQNSTMQNNTKSKLTSLALRSSLEVRNYAEIWSTPSVTESQKLRGSILLPKLACAQIDGTPETLDISNAIACVLGGRAHWLSTVYLFGLPLGKDNGPSRQIVAWPHELSTFEKLLRLLGVELDTSKIKILEGPQDLSLRHTSALDYVLDCLLEDDSQERIQKLRNLPEGCDSFWEPLDLDWLKLLLGIELVNSGDIASAQEIAINLYMRSPELEDSIQGKAIMLGALNLSYLTGIIRFSDDESRRRELLSSVSLWLDDSSRPAPEKVFNQSFSNWSGDQSFRVGSDGTKFELRAKLGAAKLSGNIGLYRSLAETVGKYLLQMAESDSDMREGIDLLIDAGCHAEAANSATRLIRDGRLSPLVSVISGFNFERISRTRFHAELDVLRVSGTYLNHVDADRIVWELLTKLDNPGDWRSYPMFNFKSQILRTVCTLYLSVSEEKQTAIRHKLLSINAQEDAFKDDFKGFLAHIPNQDWQESELERLREKLNEAPWQIERPIKLLLASRNEADEAALIEELPDCFGWGLCGISNWQSIPENVAVEVITNCDQQVTQIVNGLKNGVNSWGSFPYLQYLLHLNFEFPELARWETLIRYFSLGPATTQELAPAMYLIADNVEEIDDALRNQLCTALNEVRQTGKRFFLFGSDENSNRRCFAAVEYAYWKLKDILPDPALQAHLAQLSPEMALTMVRLRVDANPLSIVEAATGFLATADPKLNEGIIELLLRALRASPQSEPLRSLISTFVERIGEGALDAVSNQIIPANFTDFSPIDQEWLIHLLGESRSSVVRWKTARLQELM